MWQELVPPDYPEGDLKAVHCSGCGGKNRQDIGWRYCDDPEYRANLYAHLPATTMAQFVVARLAIFRYECDDCRKDKASSGDATPPTKKDQEKTEKKERKKRPRSPAPPRRSARLAQKRIAAEKAQKAARKKSAPKPKK